MNERRIDPILEARELVMIYPNGNGGVHTLDGVMS